MATHTQSANGLQFSRRYTRDDLSVFDQFEYDYRSSVIRNPSGEIVFEMTNVEVPRGWSQIATDILAQKYFRKAGVPQPDGTSGQGNFSKTGCPPNGQLLESMGCAIWLFRYRKRCHCFL